MTDNVEQWEAVLELNREIERAARHMEIEWPDVVDSWEDLAGDIQVKLVQENQAVNLLALESKPRKITLTKIAQRIASSYRDDYEYFSGNFLYSTQEVRRILEKGVLSGLHEEMEDKEGNVLSDYVGEEKLQPHQVRTQLEHLDVINAVREMDTVQKSKLFRKFVLREKPVNDADRKSMDRSVDALTLKLNRQRRKAVADHNGPGARKAMSNIQAKGVLGTQDGS